MGGSKANTGGEEEPKGWGSIFYNVERGQECGAECFSPIMQQADVTGGTSSVQQLQEIDYLATVTISHQNTPAGRGLPHQTSSIETRSDVTWWGLWQEEEMTVVIIITW